MPLSEAAALGRVLIYPAHPERGRGGRGLHQAEVLLRNVPNPADHELGVAPVGRAAEQLLKLHDLKPDPRGGDITSDMRGH